MLKLIKFLYSLWRKLKIYRHHMHVKGLVARGMKLGKNVIISTGASIDDDYAYLISIGDNCTISRHVRLLAHDATTYNFTDHYTRIGKVDIKDNCYFGENVVVLPGVTIGPNVLVAAGSVVNKDIPPNSCVAGVPARFYAKFDDFIKNHRERLQTGAIFQYADLQSKMNKELRDKIIASVKDSDAYVQGFPGRFPTNFDGEELGSV